MYSIIFLLTVAGVTLAQRPSYLGVGTGPIGRPGLANRFKTNDSVAAEEEAANGVDLGNRFGGTTEKIPVDARGDTELVNRLNQWSRDKQPFWLLNAAQIEANRNKVDGGVPMTATGPVPSAAGSGTVALGNRLGGATAPQRGGDFNGNDDFDSGSVEVVRSRPITPPPPRSSFLGPIERN